MAIHGTEKPGQADLIGPIGRKPGSEDRRHLARWVLVAFLITFTFVRIMIFQIMDHRLPDMFVYVKGTHVHHLNFGIFLLAALGGYLLFGRPKGRQAEGAAVLYGIGLALTFDEFGMWLHLGGGYWQRASFDAVTVVAGFLALMAFAPSIKEIRGKHAITIVILLLLGVGFFSFLFQTVNKYGVKVKPRPERKEMYGYSMVKHIEGLGYRVEENTLYPLLRRLEKNGWIASRRDLTEDRPRKFYAITAEGRALRADLLDVWKNQNRILDEIAKKNVHVQ
jgi:DNA-binding HxlR family transcriptional regulator